MTRIYIDNFNLVKNKSNLDDLDKYLIKSTTEYYMYSEDSIYKILPHKIVKLNQVDYPHKMERFDKLNVLIDKSRYTIDKIPINHIPFAHDVRKVLKREYKLNPLAEVKFVVETNCRFNKDTIKDDKIKDDKIKDDKIKDYYFVLKEGIEDLDHFIKENIHSFLSILGNV